MRVVHADISGYPGPSSPMRLAVDQAAATGHEMVIVGFGAVGYCGLCDKQMLDPAWVAWFKAEVAYAKSKGIEVSACEFARCLTSAPSIRILCRRTLVYLPVTP